MKIFIFGCHLSTKKLAELFLRQGDQVILCIDKEYEDVAINHYRYQDLGLPLLVFEKWSDFDLLESIQSFEPDYILSFFFAKKIPQEIVNLANRAAINIHPGPLPEVRGSEPFFWGLQKGLEKFAISAHYITQEWDAGPLICRYEFSIREEETQGTLKALLDDQVAPFFEQFSALLHDKKDLPILEQNPSPYYGRVALKDTIIDWNKSAIEIKNLISACNPSPLALSEWRNGVLYFVEAQALDIEKQLKDPGTWFSKDKSWFVQCGCGLIKPVIVAYADLGIFSMNHFATLSNIQENEKMNNACMLPAVKNSLNMKFY